jgi:hypothetical protein
MSGGKKEKPIQDKEMLRKPASQLISSAQEDLTVRPSYALQRSAPQPQPHPTQIKIKSLARSTQKKILFGSTPSDRFVKNIPS